MKIKWKIILFSFIGFIIFLVILGVIYINNVGYNNVKFMYKLNIKMDEDG